MANQSGHLTVDDAKPYANLSARLSEAFGVTVTVTHQNIDAFAEYTDDEDMLRALCIRSGKGVAV